MPAAAVTEDTTINREIFAPDTEIVGFTTAAAGDYYDSKRFAQIEAAFASQETGDGNEIQVSWSGSRVTITPITGVTKGTLVIFGRK